MTIENPADIDTINDTTDAIPEIPMRVLKVGTTASLSNRSTLGYAIGCNDAGAIFLSLRSNTAAGMFSSKWIAFLDLADALVHADRITSSTLLPLYANTSRNNAGFMLAVLLGEGLVCPSERHYMRQDFKPFLQHVNSLIAAGVDLGDADAVLEADDAREADAVAEVADVPEEPAVKRGRPAKRT
jgi:hypothetical protein